MALPDAWLTTVLDAGGDFEPPPDPQIPADYLQKPRRQHPASEPTQLLSSHHPSPPASSSRPKRRRPTLAEVDHSNDPRPCKRQRAPDYSLSSTTVRQADPAIGHPRRFRSRDPLGPSNPSGHRRRLSPSCVDPTTIIAARSLCSD
ncbi:hypothetical protein GQ44DRAFT_776760 [Phaeosphaeriaceae sp. PMI808]|nr:hypothetical protein GQ44DRAFT_776760 [Phaeosphaeriaceae sp. PMI808]